MVSSIGSVANSLFQQYQEMMTSSETYGTKQAQSFDELVGNGKISAGEESSSGSGITSMGGASGASGSSGTEANSQNSEMDLNHDGTITIDEIMQYTAMQMMEQMQDRLASDEGSDQMSQNDQGNSQQQKSDMNSFKTQMAAQAYQMGESLLNASIGAVTQSFAL